MAPCGVGISSLLITVGPFVLVLVLAIVVILAGLVVYIVHRTNETVGLRDLAELVRAVRGQRRASPARRTHRLGGGRA